MNDAQKEKQKKNLVEAGLMDEADTLVYFSNCSYMTMMTWKKGWTYFTETRFICATGFLDSNIVIPYQTIQGLKKCTQMLFPLGIAITHQNPETGKVVTNKISLLKRDSWISFMAEKAGITCL